MKNITLLTFLGIIFFNSLCLAQKSDSLALKSTDECIEIARKNTEYLIKIDGQYFSDRDYLTICNSNLPDTISIVRKDSSIVNGQNWDWSDCNCIPYIDNQAIITSGSVANQT